MPFPEEEDDAEVFFVFEEGRWSVASTTEIGLVLMPFSWLELLCWFIRDDLEFMPELELDKTLLIKGDCAPVLDSLFCVSQSHILSEQT